VKKKVSTILEASLFRRAKLEAARQGRPLSALLEAALERYLAAPNATEAEHLTVDEVWGAMAVPPDALREIMEGDDDDLYL
jgi:hypothetical protein